jgi:hypothetical protein
MFDAISVLLSGIGLVQSAGSEKVQKQMVETLESIRSMLNRQVVARDRSQNFVPDNLWLTWQDTLQSHSIVLVTGCHELSEIFDRPTAYALKFAIDQCGEVFQKVPLHAFVMGDIWFQQDPKFTARPFVLSIGGPKMNMVSAEIVAHGSTVHSGKTWSIVQQGNRFALYGQDPVDTLGAMQAFADLELMKYLNRIWR